MNKNVTTCFLCFSGFNLFKTFFENVNLCDHRLKRQGTQLVSPHSHVFSASFWWCVIFLCHWGLGLGLGFWHLYLTYCVAWFQCVERLDLAGMDFIWRIAMETPDEEIANEAIQLIITYSYTNLNPKMKKVSIISSRIDSGPVLKQPALICGVYVWDSVIMKQEYKCPFFITWNHKYGWLLFLTGFSVFAQEVHCWLLQATRGKWWNMLLWGVIVPFQRNQLLKGNFCFSGSQLGPGWAYFNTCCY